MESFVDSTFDHLLCVVLQIWLIFAAIFKAFLWGNT